ncbi:MAG: hypothetical protein SGI72_00730 [Planctomycetota bacterium]|nr:hypothetical protein [Planctomycetota bacterium]
MGSGQRRRRRVCAVVIYAAAWFASAQAGDPPFVFVPRQTPHDGLVYWVTLSASGMRDDEIGWLAL